MENKIIKWHGLPVTVTKNEHNMYTLYEPKFRLGVPNIKSIEAGLNELDSMLIGLIDEYVLCDADILTPHAKTT